MSYTGTEGETSAVFRRDLEPLMLGATAATFVAPGSVTNGQFGLYRWDIPARGGGAGGHFHRGFSESFYVVSGTVTLYNGEIWSPLPRAASATCLRGVCTASATTPTSPRAC
jgi:hypothetical protein